MTSVRRTGLSFGTGFWCLWLLSGCGGSNPPAPVTADVVEEREYDEESSLGLPTVAIPPVKSTAAKPAAAAAKPATTKGTATKPNSPNAEAPAAALPPAPLSPAGTQPAAAVTERKPPEKGSPEWLLEEIQKIKALPLPGAEQPANPPKSEEVSELEDPPEKVLTAEEEKKLKEQFEKTKAVRRERSLQIIKLAESCIAQTAKLKEDPDGLFDAAVHYLLDARLQLALQGDTASIEALYEAANVFYARKADSASAIESQLTLVNLTHACALRYGQSQPKWLQEFAKHSQLYASRFPDESHRSVALLAAAARSCELAGMNDEARSCYSMLVTKFKDTPQAKQAMGVARRLNLKGKPLELGGPTMDGGELDIESYRGKMVVVIFWATHAKPFIEQLPQLQKTLKTYEKYSVAVGVNLDADETTVESFLERSGVTWPQIFSPNRALRGWNSPLAVHYGINNLPTIWLVDPNGVVVDTAITAETLGSKMHDTYLPFLKATVKPASGVQQR